jgi:hypothetical protein
LLRGAHEPNQNSDIDTPPDDDAAAIGRYNLDAAFLRSAPFADGASRSGVTMAGTKPTAASATRRPSRHAFRRFKRSWRDIRCRRAVAAVRRGLERLSCTFFSFAASVEPAPATVHHLEPLHPVTVSKDVHKDGQHRSRQRCKAAPPEGYNRTEQGLPRS